MDRDQTQRDENKRNQDSRQQEQASLDPMDVVVNSPSKKTAKFADSIEQDPSNANVSLSSFESRNSNKLVADSLGSQKPNSNWVHQISDYETFDYPKCNQLGSDVCFFKALQPHQHLVLKDFLIKENTFANLPFKTLVLKTIIGSAAFYDYLDLLPLNVFNSELQSVADQTDRIRQLMRSTGYEIKQLEKKFDSLAMQLKGWEEIQTYAAMKRESPSSMKKHKKQ